jgi:peptide/nickel transport system substrate-binding protein
MIELDPQRGYSPESFELSRCCLVRTLFSYNGREAAEGGAEVRPDLASGLPEVSADGLTWTMRLRPGLRYAPPLDDTPIRSEDIVRALERVARMPKEETYAYYYGVIKGFDDFAAGDTDSIVGLETPDDRTLVVRLDEVSGDLAYRFSLPATGPIPPDVTEGHDRDYGRFVVASGPYMIEGSDRVDFSAPLEEQQAPEGSVPPVANQDGSVTPGSLVLVRNPSWDRATDALRPAYADRIELTLGGLDDEEVARRVDAGALDLSLGASPAEQVLKYEADPALEDRAYRNALSGIFFVTMNLAVPPFDDVHVRRAVSLAIDKEELVRLLAEPPYGPFGFWSGEVATHIASDAFEGSLLREFDPYPFDPEAAREEMRSSDYDRTGDGRCDVPACRGVRVLVMDEGVLPAQARLIRGDLAKIGIELVLDVRSRKRFFGDPPYYAGSIHDPAARNPMGISYPWAQDYPEGGGWFSGLFDSAAIGGSNTALLGADRGQLKRWGYSVTTVPNVDERIRACLELRGVTRIQCWAEFDQYLSTEVVPSVPYFIVELPQVVSERVVGYSFDEFGGQPALDRIALAPGSD